MSFNVVVVSLARLACCRAVCENEQFAGLFR